MSVISRMRKQRAVWWKRTGVNRDNSPAGYDEPVEIKCRWDDKQENVLDPGSGDMRTSRSVVYVDREIGIGDRLALMRLVDLNVDDTGPDANGGLEVFANAANPNFRNTERLLTAWL